ncbi:MAG: Crp/Fnr family transcriptional regulator, partial [Dehalococcoidia bacterium]
MADTHGTTVFDGVPAAALAGELSRLERRTYAAGATLIGEGDEHPDEMYVVEAGVADVFVADRKAHEHLVGRAGPGEALGEMALFTGQRAGASVRAASDLDVLVMPRAELHRIAATYPGIYRNLGVILAERLTLSNRRFANAGAGRVTLFDDRGAPPLLGYALACSLAWHVRRPVLLLLIAEQAPDGLAAFARPADPLELLRGGWGAASAGDPAAVGRAELAVAAPSGRFAPKELVGLLQELCETYDFVLVQRLGLAHIPMLNERTLRLLDGQASAAGGESRAGHSVRGWVAGASRPRPGRDGVLDVPPLSAADEAAL